MAQLPNPDPQLFRYVEATDVPASEIQKARPVHIADLPDGSSAVAADLSALEARVAALEDAANG